MPRNDNVMCDSHYTKTSRHLAIVLIPFLLLLSLVFFQLSFFSFRFTQLSWLALPPTTPPSPL